MKKRILLFAVSLILVLGFTACGKAKQSAEELIQQENEIIAEHQDLWDLAFNAVDKDTVGSQTGDYADFLKMALENGRSAAAMSGKSFGREIWKL